LYFPNNWFKKIVLPNQQTCQVIGDFPHQDKSEAGAMFSPDNRPLIIKMEFNAGWHPPVTDPMSGFNLT
jgi:hypothetical protein